MKTTILIELQLKHQSSLEVLLLDIDDDAIYVFDEQIYLEISCLIAIVEITKEDSSIV
jgi:hypothetical protein